MNINQVGLYSQGSEKSNNVSNKSYAAVETVKSSHITVGQSSIQNALASSCNTYQKNSGVQEAVSVKQEVKKNTC